MDSHTDPSHSSGYCVVPAVLLCQSLDLQPDLPPEARPEYPEKICFILSISFPSVRILFENGIARQCKKRLQLIDLKIHIQLIDQKKRGFLVIENPVSCVVFFQIGNQGGDAFIEILADLTITGDAIQIPESEQRSDVAVQDMAGRLRVRILFIPGAIIQENRNPLLIDCHFENRKGSQ